MSLRISDFFWEDLIEEQHRWSIEQMAMFYQTTEEEVISALVKANEKFATDPRSACYRDPDLDGQGSATDSVLETPCGDVQRDSGKARDKGSP
jgi:hypothetical protein